MATERNIYEHMQAADARMDGLEAQVVELAETVRRQAAVIGRLTERAQHLPSYDRYGHANLIRRPEQQTWGNKLPAIPVGPVAPFSRGRHADRVRDDRWSAPMSDLEALNNALRIEVEGPWHGEAHRRYRGEVEWNDGEVQHVEAPSLLHCLQAMAASR